jgi:hypothetical protein
MEIGLQICFLNLIFKESHILKLLYTEIKFYNYKLFSNKTSETRSIEQLF